MRNYGVIYNNFWSSSTIHNLSDDGKLLALYLLSSPHTSMIGLFRLPDGYVSEDLNWGFERVSKGFENLSANGFATRDSVSKWVFIHKYLHWNKIQNQNQAKSAIKVLLDAPDKIPFKTEVARVLIDSCRRFKGDIDQEFETLTQTLSKPLPNQEQEQEQEQYQKEHTDDSGESSDCENEIPVPEIPNQKFPEPRKPKSDYSEEFTEIWETLSKNWNGKPGSKLEASRAFAKLKPDSETIEKIYSGHARQFQAHQALVAAGQFSQKFKHVCRWLTLQCWNDDPEPVQAAKPANGHPYMQTAGYRGTLKRAQETGETQMIEYNGYPVWVSPSGRVA